MSVDGFTAAVDDFKEKLELLDEAWMELQRCDSLDHVYPLVDDIWNEYSTARTDAERALSRLVQEVTGLFILAQIVSVRAEEAE